MEMVDLIDLIEEAEDEAFQIRRMLDTLNENLDSPEERWTYSDLELLERLIGACKEYSTGETHS